MLRVFIGYDDRQPISYNVAQFSIVHTSSVPVAITPIIHHQVDPVRTGLTPFTFSRFLVPKLCDYEGWALFVDSDVLIKGDIKELFAKADDKYAVMVCKGNASFEHAAVMLMNCSKLKMLTPEFINTVDKLHSLSFVNQEDIGDIGKEWGYLSGYETDNISAKLIHYTQGVPAFPETQGSPLALSWLQEKQLMNYAVTWTELMGNSVHAAAISINGREYRVPKFVAAQLQQQEKLKA